MLNYIKKHKLTTFIIVVYIIVIGFAFFVYNLFIGSSGLPVYGDRLDGIEDVPITEEQISKMVEEIKKDDNVIKVTTPYLNGKILKVIITVHDKASPAPVKALSSKITEQLTEEQKKFYDVELYIKKNYNCTLEATGNVDEDGNFVDTVKVKFRDNLSKSDPSVEYGIGLSDKASYNKEQTIEIKEDGEKIVYGYTKDKGGEEKCSIKIVKKSGEKSTQSVTIDSVTNRNFPIIAYRKNGESTNFVWTKDR